jgi:outer membrane PBP1 activator LpoA protein
MLALAALPFCVAAQVPASTDAANPSAPANALTAPAPTGVDPAPDIALLLPLQSRDFGRAAEALWRGFLAALKTHDETLNVVAFPTDSSPEQMLVAYAAALRRGARVVVGPMTRSTVSALAGSGLVSVPTLALNAPDGDPALPRHLYWFGLSADSEARQVAAQARHERQRFCFLVVADAPLARRAAQAFSEAFQAQGGRVMQTFLYNPGESAFPAIRDRLINFESGCVFLAADADQARLVRPYLSNSLTVYATSLVNVPGVEPRNNLDLNGIRFVDMPWLLQPDHPAVMIYPRENSPDAGNLERFYALGIDAFRIAAELMRSPRATRIELDGVTGRIRLGRNNQILREPSPATFRAGTAVAQEQDESR